ncbi:MAG: hypothetical protein H3C57_03950 [Gammaproteobacteria bacterium]|nr:hypothetical protein [Gammaproteobacteria bacterium]
MMGSFGRFLELSLPAGDVLHSLRFYRSLGFGELPTGDIRRWHYAVVSGSGLALGLHGGGIAEPALCFVRPGLAEQARRLGAEEFHELALRSPDGHLVLLLEARTFSPGAAEEDAVALLGREAELVLDCAELATSRAFYEAAGFIGPGADETREEDGLALHGAGLRLVLREARRPGGLALRFPHPEPASLVAGLEARGLAPGRLAGGLQLRSPEGLQLLVG